MTKKEKEKALKEVDRQLEEKKTIPVPEDVWQKIIDLSELMEVDKQAQTDRDYDREEAHRHIWKKHAELRKRLKPHRMIEGIGEFAPDTSIDEAKKVIEEIPGALKEKTFILSKSEWDRLRSTGHDADNMNSAIDAFSRAMDLFLDYYLQWANDRISDKAFLSKTFNIYQGSQEQQEDINGWAKTTCEIFDFLGWIEDGRPERKEEDDDEVPF